MENIRLNNGLNCPLIGILDFSLTDQEMVEISKLNSGKRYYTRTEAALQSFAAWQPTYEA